MVHAKKEIIKVGSIALDVFMLPDATYRMSLTSVTDAIGKQTRSYNQFLRTHTPLARVAAEQPVEEVTFDGYNLPALGINTTACSSYWIYWVSKGNDTAERLITAITQETLDMRLDHVFKGVAPDIEVSNDRIAERVEELQKYYSNKLPYYNELFRDIETRYYRKADYYIAKKNELLTAKGSKRKTLESEMYYIGKELLAFRSQYEAVREEARKELGIDLARPLPEYYEAEFLQYEPPRGLAFHLS